MLRPARLARGDRGMRRTRAMPACKANPMQRLPGSSWAPHVHDHRNCGSAAAVVSG